MSSGNTTTLQSTVEFGRENATFPLRNEDSFLRSCETGLPKDGFCLTFCCSEPRNYHLSCNSCFAQEIGGLARLLAQSCCQEVQWFDFIVMKHVPNAFRSIENALNVRRQWYFYRMSVRFRTR